MSRGQFSFLMGFLFAWLIWAASFWVAVGALVVGLIAYVGVLAFEGELDLRALGDRLSTSGRRT